MSPRFPLDSAIPIVCPSENNQSRAGWLAPAVTFVVATLFFGGVFQSLPVLYDTDSYYHLAIARAYARHGIIDTLPWAQLSLLHDFADKELLFHVVLAPWADTDTATVGGRWALAVLNGLIAAVLTALGQRAIGRRLGWLVPLLVYAGSLDFLGRMIRLRPEVLSLLLLLVAAVCAGSRRYRLLGLVTLLYTLAYTAFHALLGLCGLWFLGRLLHRRRAEWGLLLYPVLGAGAGLVLHPHFPRNLVIWKVQSIDFFQLKGTLDVGTEIRPHTLGEWLDLNLVWLLATPLVVWLLRRRKSGKPTGLSSGGEEGAIDRQIVWWIGAAVFGLLYVQMARFSTYFLPFATLALLSTFATPTPTGSPRRYHGLRASGLVALLLFGCFRVGVLLYGLGTARGPVPREGEWAEFGRRVPAGATVAAEWGSTHLYMFWAPQAAFLNVLDPIFMAVPFPEAHRALRGLFDGREPDIASVLHRDLLSDHIALSRYHRPQLVTERLAHDPRLRLRHDGYTLLYEVVGDVTGQFVLDWTVLPKGLHLPPDPARPPAGDPYPRASQPRLRDLEAYVDGGRMMGAEDRCIAFAHSLQPAESASGFRLAPYGPSRVWIDDRLAIAVDEPLLARLGDEHTLPFETAGGDRLLTVLTCRAQPGDPAGFFLRRR